MTDVLKEGEDGYRYLVVCERVVVVLSNGVHVGCGDWVVGWSEW